MRLKTTAEIVHELGELLEDPEIPVPMETTVCALIARFVELEPENRELDDWRNTIRSGD
jgi:hypothetical protein